MRAGPVISAVPGWRDGFVVGEPHVLPAYQGQGLGRSLITALLHPAPDAACAVLCEARKPYGPFRRPFDQGTIGRGAVLT
jgi:GNAT superfamily N-acetyltransferase